MLTSGREPKVDVGVVAAASKDLLNYSGGAGTANLR
jgi:hypothetical protein